MVQSNGVSNTNIHSAPFEQGSAVKRMIVLPKVPFPASPVIGSLVSGDVKKPQSELETGCHTGTASARLV